MPWTGSPLRENADLGARVAVTVVSFEATPSVSKSPGELGESRSGGRDSRESFESRRIVDRIDCATDRIGNGAESRFEDLDDDTPFAERDASRKAAFDALLDALLDAFLDAFFDQSLCKTHDHAFRSPGDELTDPTREFRDRRRSVER